MKFFVLSVLITIQAIAAPIITCVKKDFDFGTLDDSQIAKHTYIIQNTGNKDLKIGDIRSCCGSTAKISSKLIKPGTQAELKVELNLKNRHGVQNKNVFIASNDLKNPYLKLTFNGNVVKRVLVSSRFLQFGAVKESQEKEVLISSLQELAVKSNKSSSEAYEIKSISKTDAPVLKKGDKPSPYKYFLKVMIRVNAEKLKAGKNNGTITLFTDNKNLSNIRLYCRATFTPQALKVVPSEITLKASGKAVKRYVKISAKKDGDVVPVFKILSVELPDKEMKYKISGDAQRGYLLTLSNIRGGGSIAGQKIVVKTDFKGGSEVEVADRVSR
ncbi:MAG: DUF1573 domain-containing protein [Lentisphaeraceae bacterium]|nr:DUF1573 domain-containing protein [Lentisphaeraceae bacterium]